MISRVSDQLTVLIKNIVLFNNYSSQLRIIEIYIGFVGLVKNDVIIIIIQGYNYI